MARETVLELKNISKSFGEVHANKNINLSLAKGEILSILGENGSGKTTLMNMISGIYYPDDGHIYINGEEVFIRTPKDAFNYKIGMGIGRQVDRRKVLTENRLNRIFFVLFVVIVISKREQNLSFTE